MSDKGTIDLTKKRFTLALVEQGWGGLTFWQMLRHAQELADAEVRFEVTLEEDEL